MNEIMTLIGHLAAIYLLSRLVLRLGRRAEEARVIDASPEAVQERIGRRMAVRGRGVDRRLVEERDGWTN